MPVNGHGMMSTTARRWSSFICNKSGHIPTTTNHHHQLPKPEVVSGQTCYDLPVRELHDLRTRVTGACTGPERRLIEHCVSPFNVINDEDSIDFIDDGGGTIDTSSDGETLMVIQQPPAAIDWTTAGDHCFGNSLSLYERHPRTRQRAGEPLADSFAVVCFENWSVACVADGVNWGIGSALASRLAVDACTDYLVKSVRHCSTKTTLDVFVSLLRAFAHAQEALLRDNEATFTTLCAAVTLQLRHSSKFICCTCNVGDSLAYVYSPRHGVREMTEASRDVDAMRDMSDALGALGAVNEKEPALANLTCAMTLVEEGDIVFLVTDGVSDNLDPVVGHFAIAMRQQQQENQPVRRPLRRSNSSPSPGSCAPPKRVTARERHELTLARIEDLIRNGFSGNVKTGDIGEQVSALGVCQRLLAFCEQLTRAKRRVLEDEELYEEDATGEGEEDNFSAHEQRRRRRRVRHRLALVPGKLDHATCCAFRVGFYGNATSPINELPVDGLLLRARLASHDDDDDIQ